MCACSEQDVTFNRSSATQDGWLPATLGVHSLGKRPTLLEPQWLICKMGQQCLDHSTAESQECQQPARSQTQGWSPIHRTPVLWFLLQTLPCYHLHRVCPTPQSSWKHEVLINSSRSRAKCLMCIIPFQLHSPEKSMALIAILQMKQLRL